MIELVSVVIMTFALALIALGTITVWLENGRRRLLGIALGLVGLAAGITYLFLGSRFSLALFGHLVVRVDLPTLMATAFTYTAGVLLGISLAAGLFLWVTGRFHRRSVVAAAVTIAMGLLIAGVGITIAALLGKL